VKVLLSKWQIQGAAMSALPELHSRNSHARMNVCFDRRSFLVLAGALPVASACGANDASRRLTRRGTRLFLNVRINGVMVEALLDSAAETTIADIAFAARLGLTGGEAQTARGTGAATIDAKLIPHVRLEAAGIVVSDATVAVIDLTEVGRHLIGRRVDLILGREIFDTGRVLVDISSGLIGRHTGASDPPGLKLPLTGGRGNELIPIMVEGAQAIATFDLGNGSSLLFSRAFAKAHLLDGRAVGRISGGGIGGSEQRDSVIVKSLSIAGRVFPNVPASIDDGPEAVEANVGVGILRHFRIVADFPGKAVWLA